MTSPRRSNGSVATSRSVGKSGGTNLAGEIERYIELHPGSPAAVRRPQIVKRGPTWVALLGSNFETGIVGLGTTVNAALRSFDSCYLASWHPPVAR
jgi:hypothetical protein